MAYWIIIVSIFWIFVLLFWQKAPWIEGFFDGLFLAFLCFCFLPLLLEGVFFWCAAMLLLLGVLGSAFLEQKTNGFYYGTRCHPLCRCIAFSAAIFLWHIIPLQRGIFLVPASLMSGLFLLLACGGILPEIQGKEKIKLAVMGLFGFLGGIVLLFPL